MGLTATTFSSQEKLTETHGQEVALPRRAIQVAVVRPEVLVARRTSTKQGLEVREDFVDEAKVVFAAAGAVCELGAMLRHCGSGLREIKRGRGLADFEGRGDSCAWRAWGLITSGGVAEDAVSWGGHLGGEEGGSGCSSNEKEQCGSEHGISCTVSVGIEAEGTFVLSENGSSLAEARGPSIQQEKRRAPCFCICFKTPSNENRSHGKKKVWR
jgi:hypothetical protein